MINRASALTAAAALAALFSLGAGAGQIYVITIDTSTAPVSDGAIYFQFNPGSGTASATVEPFSAGTGVLGAGVGTNDFQDAPRPPYLILRNTSSNNDYTQYLTFGDTVSFSVAFDSTPPASAIFSFAATGPDGVTPILLNDPNGYFLGDISFDEDGAWTVNNYHADLVTIDNAIPEPSTLSLLAIGLALAGLRHRR
jgi:hypothetical protein